MCGNVALVTLTKKTTDWKKRSDWMRGAIMLDTLRGTDGTGLCYVPFDNKEYPEVLKYAIPGPSFLENKRVASVMHDIDKYCVVMGHNRAATKGRVDSVSAHPFTYEHITLCHNGTLRGNDGVPSGYTVDSEAIAHAFAENGAKTTLEKLRGAYAIQWYDAKQKTYNIARNVERPLAIGFSKDGEQLYVASESWMIRELAYKYGIKLDENMHSLNPGYILRWYMDDPKQEKDMRSYWYEEFDIAPPSTYGSYSGTQANFTPSGSAANSSNHSTPKKLLENRSAYDKIKEYPTDRKGKYNKKLAAVGIKLGDVIEVSHANFQAYTNYSGGNTIGKVGFLYEYEKNEFAECMCYYVEDMDEFDDIYNTFYGVVVACSEHEGSLVVTLEDLCTADDYEAGNEDAYVISYIGPDGEWLQKDEIEKLVKDGCGICKEPINLNDDDAYWLDWTDDGKPMCMSCFAKGN